MRLGRKVYFSLSHTHPSFFNRDFFIRNHAVMKWWYSSVTEIGPEKLIETELCDAQQQRTTTHSVSNLKHYTFDLYYLRSIYLIIYMAEKRSPGRLVYTYIYIFFSSERNETILKRSIYGIILLWVGGGGCKKLDKTLICTIVIHSWCVILIHRYQYFA